MAAPGTGHEFEFTGIDGRPLPLAQYRGKPVLVVNTASHCGFTPQYRELQELWRRYRGLGLTVVGVPSNDFGRQEPGSETEIKHFCESNFDVDFPLTAKQKVVGDDAHPFYQWAAEQAGNAAQPQWNFHKLLIGPYGEIAGTWPSQVKPLDKSITEAIEAFTGKPA
jgi:glutathione peroxidase